MRSSTAEGCSTSVRVGIAPAQAEQRRAAGGRHVARGVAAKHQPAVRGGRLDGPLRADQPRQPGHGVGVVVEPGDLPAADGQRRLRPPPFQGHQRPLRLVRQPRFQPAGGHGQRQRRLEAIAAVRGIAQAPQGQRTGQRQAVIQIIEAQEEGRLITGPGVEISPRDLRQFRRIAADQGFVQHPLRAAAAVQLVQLAAFTRHLAHQPLRLGLQAPMDRRLLVRLEEEIVGRFQDLVQASDRVAVMALFQPFLRPGPLLQDRPIGGKKEAVDQLFAGPRIRARDSHPDA